MNVTAAASRSCSKRLKRSSSSSSSSCDGARGVLASAEESIGVRRRVQSERVIVEEGFGILDGSGPKRLLVGPIRIIDYPIGKGN